MYTVCVHVHTLYLPMDCAVCTPVLMIKKTVKKPIVNRTCPSKNKGLLKKSLIVQFKIILSILFRQVLSYLYHQNLSLCFIAFRDSLDINVLEYLKRRGEGYNEDRQERGSPRTRIAKNEDHQERGSPRTRIAKNEDHQERGSPRTRITKNKDYQELRICWSLKYRNLEANR